MFLLEISLTGILSWVQGKLQTDLEKHVLFIGETKHTLSLESNSFLTVKGQNVADKKQEKAALIYFKFLFS